MDLHIALQLAHTCIDISSGDIVRLSTRLFPIDFPVLWPQRPPVEMRPFPRIACVLDM